MKNIFPFLKSDGPAELQAAFNDHTEKTHECVINLRKTLHHYCDGDVESAKVFAKQVISLEAKADETRRLAEKKLYAGVLIPFGRGDKYALMEAIDDIADKAEIIVRLAAIELPKIPAFLKHDMKTLANQVELSMKVLKEAVEFLDMNINKAIKIASKVELVREKVRNLEFEILKKLFSGGSKDIHTILLKELITLTGQVADKAEEAADRVITLAVKYQS